jgi:tRNA-modifying protein YgfZ
MTSLFPAQYGCLQVQGPGAKKFLQGQLTCDLEQIRENQRILAAHCNPQGRIISFFYISYEQAAYYLLMREDMLAIALAALKKYSIFYQTDMHILSQAAVPELNHLQLIEAGIPTIYPQTSGQFLPHELNLQELGAISFNKGCYTGQEVIARMHYKAKLKKRMYLANIHSASPPSPLDLIYKIRDQQKKEGGLIVDVCRKEHQLYAALILIEISEANNQHLFLTDEQLCFDIQSAQREHT